jgi:homoserine acetyltransferase
VKQTWATRDFRLQSGYVLPELTLAYESWGRLAPGGRNTVLVTHGFTSSQHAAGKHDPSDEVAGWWDGLIGPGKAIDTDRYWVIASNMLSRTDRIFPPSLAPGVMAALEKAGVQASYFEIDTDLGHVASGPEWAKWGPTLRTFMDGLGDD